MKPRACLWLAVALVAAARLFLLSQRGDYLGYDESYYILLARNIFSGHGYTLNGLPHASFPPLTPLCIGLFSLLFGNAVFASRFISAVAGALLILPVFALARELAGDRAARVSALIVALMPSLNDFMNLGRPYRDILYAGSEPLYLLLLLSALLFAYRAAGPGPIAFGSGLLLGAAYLTRPEAVLFLPVFLLWRSGIFGNRAGSRVIGIALTLAGFLLSAIPYLVFQRGQTGRWVLTEKLDGQEDYRRAMYGVIEKNQWEDFARVRYALNAPGDGMASPYWGIDPRLTAAGTEAADRRAGLQSAAVFKNLGLFFSVAPAALFPIYLYPLAALGLLAGLIPGRRRRQETGINGFLALTLVPQAIILLVAYPVPRHHLPLTVVLSLWAGAGFDRLLDWRWKAALVELICLFLIVTNIRQWAVDPAGERARIDSQAKRILSGDLQKRTRPDEAIMSWDPALAVWAERDWRVLPYDSEERIIAYARRVSARYLVFSRLSGFRWAEYFRGLPVDMVYKIVDLASAPASMKTPALKFLRKDDLAVWFSAYDDISKTH